MKDSEFDALLRSALLEAARLDAEALTEGEPEAPPRSLEYQAEMAALLRDPIRGRCSAQGPARPVAAQPPVPLGGLSGAGGGSVSGQRRDLQPERPGLGGPLFQPAL